MPKLNNTQTAPKNSKGAAQNNKAENSKAGRTATELHTFNAMVKETVVGIINIVKNRLDGFDDFDITDKVVSDFTAFDNSLTFNPDLAKEVGCYLDDAMDNIELTVEAEFIYDNRMDVLRWIRSRLAITFAMSKAYEDWMNYDDDNTGLWDKTCDGVAEALFSIYPMND